MLISLLVCLLPYLMSPSLLLWSPPPLKKSVIIPVPKNSKPSCLNDYCPVALTSTVMKVFERLLKKHICSSIPATLDPLQFAYRPNRSTDDAISQVLHSSLTHIDSNVNTYTPTTACPLTAPLLSLNLRMILWSWASLTTTTRPHT